MPTTQLYFTRHGLLNGCRVTGGIIQYVGLYKTQIPLSKGFDPTTIVEADFSGYARIDLDATIHGAPAIDADGNATQTWPEQTWTKSGATANAEVWGFFYLATDNTTILLAQEFAAAPYPMVTDGDLIRLTPRYSVSNPILP